MRFEYHCHQCGFDNGPWERGAPAWTLCYHCGGFAHLRPLEGDLLGDVQIIDDVPEHFSVSMGVRVRSRRHLYQLYREKGLSDFEHFKVPSSNVNADPRLPWL